MKKGYFADKDIEIIIGNLLRAGVLISSTIVIIGGIIYLWQNGSKLPSYEQFHGMQSSFFSLAQVFNGVSRGSGQHIVQLGVLLLIATPIARIVFSIFGFIKEKDRLYIVITLIVLIIISSSIIFKLKG